MESRTELVETVGTGCVACAGDVEVGALSDGELAERMTQLGRERSRVDAMLAETAAEMHRRVGGRGTAALMRERLHVSAVQATADTALAASLAEYPATLEAWRSGEIIAGHARVIARVGADPEHADEPALLEMARGYPVDMFARMTRQYMSSQDSSAEHKRQRENRWASLVQDPRRVMAAVGLLRSLHRQAGQHRVQPDGAQIPQRRAKPRTGELPAP